MSVSSNLHWSWSEAWRGACTLLPGAMVCALGNPKTGLLLATCCLPLGLFGVRGPRRARVKLFGVAALISLTYACGSLLLGQWPLDVFLVFVAAYMSVILAPRLSLGFLGPLILLPVFVVAINKVNTSAGLELATMLGIGGAWASLVACAWPESVPLARANPEFSWAQLNRYGLLLACAVATTMVIDHVFLTSNAAWGAIATTLVMRPRGEVVTLRGIGRVVATFIGVILAWMIFPFMNVPWLMGAAVLLVGALVLGIRQSRWYLVPLGLATLVMLLLGAMEPDAFYANLETRLLQNAIGAASAMFFGLLVPLILERRAKPEM